jgi:hypothetical protein
MVIAEKINPNDENPRILSILYSSTDPSNPRQVNLHINLSEKKYSNLRSCYG